MKQKIFLSYLPRTKWLDTAHEYQVLGADALPLEQKHPLWLIQYGKVGEDGHRFHDNHGNNEQIMVMIQTSDDIHN